MSQKELPLPGCVFFPFFFFPLFSFNGTKAEHKQKHKNLTLPNRLRETDDSYQQIIFSHTQSKVSVRIKMAQMAPLPV